MKLRFKAAALALAALAGSFSAVGTAHADGGTAYLERWETVNSGPDDSTPTTCQSRNIWLKSSNYAWHNARWEDANGPIYGGVSPGATRYLYLAADWYTWTVCLVGHSGSDSTYDGWGYYEQKSYLARMGNTPGFAQMTNDQFYPESPYSTVTVAWGSTLSPY